jgi:hypothetical protein
MSKNLWLEFSMEASRSDGLSIPICGLCGNSGIVDTTTTAKWFDKPAGIKTFCICPNGRTLKKHKQSIGR